MKKMEAHDLIISLVSGRGRFCLIWKPMLWILTDHHLHVRACSHTLTTNDNDTTLGRVQVWGTAKTFPQGVLTLSSPEPEGALPPPTRYYRNGSSAQGPSGGYFELNVKICRLRFLFRLHFLCLTHPHTPSCLILTNTAGLPSTFYF